jgi:hypothetical protein
MHPKAFWSRHISEPVPKGSKNFFEPRSSTISGELTELWLYQVWTLDSDFTSIQHTFGVNYFHIQITDCLVALSTSRYSISKWNISAVLHRINVFAALQKSMFLLLLHLRENWTDRQIEVCYLILTMTFLLCSDFMWTPVFPTGPDWTWAFGKQHLRWALMNCQYSYGHNFHKKCVLGLRRSGEQVNNTEFHNSNPTQA